MHKCAYSKSTLGHKLPKNVITLNLKCTLYMNHESTVYEQYCTQLTSPQEISWGP
jgi:hypothetical protein